MPLIIQCSCNASYARLSGFNGYDGGIVHSMHELFYRRKMPDASDNLALIGVAGFFQRGFFQRIVKFSS